MSNNEQTQMFIPQDFMAGMPGMTYTPPQTQRPTILAKAGLSIMMIIGFMLLIVVPPLTWLCWPEAHHDKKWVLWGLGIGVAYGSAFALPAVLYWRKHFGKAE